MADLYHQWGSDLMLGTGGDLATVSGTLLGQQRLLRRLLTNSGDYMWQLDYGAGLGQFVGSPASPLHIRAVIRGQMFKEAAVSHNPEPVIEVDPPAPGGSAGVYVDLKYADADSGQTWPLSFSVGEQ